MILDMILAPTALQANRQVDGSLTVAVAPTSVEGHISALDYYDADLAGAIEIHVSEPLMTGYVSINYSII